MGWEESLWHPYALGGSLLAGIALFTTYLLPGTAGLWHVVDVRVAFALNGLVAHDHYQRIVWAFGNARVFDYLIGAIMLLVLLHYVRYGRRASMAVRGAEAIIVCVMLVVLVSITRNLIFGHMPHASPSLVLHPFTLLQGIDGLHVKYASHTSFPGDHATVVATFVFLLWTFAGRRYGLVAALIAVIACLPRLVAGAHWFTDDVVGGLGTALVTVPFVVFTPAGPWLVDRLAQPLARLGR